MGASDYIVKPFSPSELGARIRAALRKRRPAELPEAAEPYVLGDLALNFLERRVTPGRAAAGADCDRVPAARRTRGDSRPRGHQRPAAGAHLGRRNLSGHGTGAQHRLEAAPQARGQRERLQIHLQRVPRRLPHREAAGVAGDTPVTGCEAAPGGRAARQAEASMKPLPITKHVWRENQEYLGLSTT